MSDRMTISLTVNQVPHTVTVPTHLTLADLLRDQFGMHSVKLSCHRAVCGVCTVLMDGAPTASCAVFAFQADGAHIRTVEGLKGQDGRLDPLQEAFARHGAFQCGYCTSGMIMLARALLDQHPRPDREQVLDWVSSNVCRCTGYVAIVDAVLSVADSQTRDAG